MDGRQYQGYARQYPQVARGQALPGGALRSRRPAGSVQGKQDRTGEQEQAGLRKGGVFQPDFEARDLRNSLLEKYPVESLKMIGYLNINRRPIAVIQVEDKVKQVKVGDYLGLDFGMVTQITDKEVVMRELIQDSAGDWSERTSSLYLQAKEGSKK
ncbi:MAG: pilus assembly protein PilP [Dechloromonas sp.]|nr:MAG: pilus assembly protein PilP [Dechloromonas sp.]